MENTYADRQKDDRKVGDSFYSSCKSHKSADQRALYISESKGWTLAKGGKPGRTLTLKLIQSEACENWFQELFLKRPRGLGISIPKHVVNLEEKYLKRCLEHIHMNFSKGAPCAISVGSLDVGFVSDCATVGRKNSIDATKFAIDYPRAVSGDLAKSSDEEIVGSIMESNSMISILKSPLFQRLGISDHVARLGGTSLFENKRCNASDNQGSPGRSTFSPSQKSRKDPSSLKDHRCKSDSVKTSPMSDTSSVSVFTDQSSASCFSRSCSQGMLQCTWDNGTPHFAFSLDDQKELYVANAYKAEVTNDKALDYVYYFHLNASGQKMFDFSDSEANLIGKMKVSTSFSLCSSSSKVRETEFVLVGANDNYAREMHSLARNSRRSRKLSRVMEVFKGGHSIKQRSPSIFGGSSAILEDFSAAKDLEQCLNPCNQFRPEVSENDFLPNLELASIVVKDHIRIEEQQKEELGGWGLKFLKKTKVKPSVESTDASAPSECCLRNAGNCSTSMDIIVPAGCHGGPRTRDGGPSSLIERWRSSGHCDCGGWDIGCPLKVLKARPRREEGSPHTEAQEGCKSFDMFTEGSEEGTPSLKMVNIRDGLYFISFQSSFLSALQCFSIAVATIHSQSPSLRPKHVQD